MILLTGATGTIGSELARILGAKGIKFRAYIRDVKKGSALKIPNMEIVKGDLEDKVALKKAMRGISRVFLLSRADPLQAQLQGNVIRTAKAEGVTLIVKQSAFGVSPDSPVSLARWHWETEEELRKSGIQFCILRPMMFMQNLLMNAEEVKSTGTIFAPMGDVKASYIDARDIAKCAATILTGTGFGGRIYELTGPKAITYGEIATALSKVSGHDVKYVNITLEETKNKMLAAKMPEWIASDITKLYEIFASGRASVVTTSVRDITGDFARDINTFCHDYAEVFAGELVHH